MTDADKIADALREGQAALEREDMATAYRCFSAVIALDPRNFFGHYYRGLSHESFPDELDQALADLDAALRLDPKAAAAYAARGSVYAHKGEYASALADLDEAIRLDPTLEDAYFTRASCYAATGNHEAAIRDRTRAVDAAPDQAVPLLNRGLSRTDGGDFEGAIADFTRALALNPALLRAYNDRGSAWLLRGDLGRAVADFEEGLRLGADPWPHHCLGYAYYLQGRSRDAVGYYERYPRSARYQRMAAWILATAPDAAVRDGTRAVVIARAASGMVGGAAMAPHHYDFAATQAAALAAAGDFNGAVSEQGRAIGLAKGYPAAARKLAGLERTLALFRGRVALIDADATAEP